LRQTLAVPKFCSCRAELPDGALFCHRCGKPQREDLIAAEEEAAAAEPVQRPTEPQSLPDVPQREVGPHSRIAVRSALLVGIASLLVISLPLPAAIHRLWVLGWLLFSGFLAVALYSRRTGESVPLRTGLRIGWLTGFFCCLVASALLGLVALIARSQGGFQEMLREAMNRKDIPEDQGAQMIEMLSHGEALIFAMLAGFLLFTSLSAIGGLVGARLLRKNT
jgi:pheromone shutdown protein TraB